MKEITSVIYAGPWTRQKDERWRIVGEALEQVLHPLDDGRVVVPERERPDAREAVDVLVSVDVLDAVECNYVPGTEARLEAFLEDADFEYALGSVHLVEGCDVTAAAAVAERWAVVDAYYEALVQLIESELFDVVGHVDLPERVEPLRGLTTDAHYRAVADALAASSTVPELNAGRVHRDLGRLHPNSEFLEPFLERDIAFVLGSDSHAPQEIRARSEVLTDFVRDRPGLRLAPPPLRSRS